MADNSDTEIAVAIAIHEQQVPITVGRATIAWNTMSGAVFDLFSILSEMDEASAKGVFVVVSSDRSQRDMVSELVRHRLKPIAPKQAKQAQKLLAAANALAGRRNDILHVVFRQSLTPEKVYQLHERGHLKGKVGKPLLDTIHAFTIECLDLSIEMAELRGKILQTQHYQTRSLAGALLSYTPRLTAQGLASQGEFGLLNVGPTNPEILQQGFSGGAPLAPPKEPSPEEE